MNREKSTGKRKNLRYKLIITILVILSIILSACPPLEEDPYENTLVFDGSLDSSKWMEILYIIQTRGMPVNLDISACTVPEYGADVLKRVYEDGEDLQQDRDETVYTQFNPLSGFPYGKEYIRSIILPKAATMISHATDIDVRIITEDDAKKSAFRHFTNLRSVTGRNIGLIGNLAFIENETLEEVNFSRAVHIMQFAFYGCTSLREAHFEVVRDIMPSAFENCSNLEKAIFPYVGIVSQKAFKSCKSLTEVSFDVATKIGDDAFRDCTSLKYARFRADPKRTTTGHPLEPFMNKTGSIVTDDSLIFYPNSLRGCRSLEILDVRYAWNVYFSGGALAEIGKNLELFLYDDRGEGKDKDDKDKGGKCYGHPQTDMYLGEKEGSGSNGRRTLESILIRAPVVTPREDSQIENYTTKTATTGILHDLQGRYGEGFVKIQRGPALL